MRKGGILSLLRKCASYYAYVIVQSDVSEVPVEENDEEADKGGLKIALFIIAAISVGFVGYQIVKFKKKVRIA